jgi:transcriptional regulator of acetoin/glycerol metabolism
MAASVAPSTLPDVERELILECYSACGGNITAAARNLGIPRTTLRDKLRRFGVR